MTPRLASVPITAFSVANALGSRTRAVLDAVRSGTSGLRPPSAPLPFATALGELSGTLPPLPPDLAPYDSRVARIAWLAMEEMLPRVRGAVSRWGAERVAIVIGTSTGGIAESERAFGIVARGDPLPADYSVTTQHAFDGIVRLLCAGTGAAGPAFAVSTACASSGKVFGSAQRLLATGLADAVLVGGADSLCQTTLRGFAGLSILSARPCRPFDTRRDGISIGEGAAFALLEREAAVDLHLLAVGETSDAHHMTAPHPEGLGAALAMQQALSEASVDPSDVSYVNAHGTATPANDQTESDAILRVLGAGVPVSSTKGMTGHLLGAAGATEAVICLDALAGGYVPPSVGCEEQDPRIGVHVVTRTLERPLTTALGNSFAFGGCNASVLFSRVPASRASAPARDVHVRGLAFWAPGFPRLDRALSGQVDESAKEPAAKLLPARARGRASLLTRVFAEIVGQLGELPGLDLATVPIVYGSALGEMATTLALLRGLAAGDALLSPLRFQASVHNTAAGILSIQTGNRSFSTAVAAGNRTAAMALVEGYAWVAARGGDALVVLAEEDVPAPLWTGAPYGALAYGFWLSAVSGEGSSVRLRVDRTAGGSAGIGFVRYADHPLAGGLALLEAVAAGKARKVTLGPSDLGDWSASVSSRGAP